MGGKGAAAVTIQIFAACVTTCKRETPTVRHVGASFLHPEAGCCTIAMSYLRSLSSLSCMTLINESSRARARSFAFITLSVGTRARPRCESAYRCS